MGAALPITIIEIILILAAAQGFFLSMVIFRKYARIYAARFVGLLILLYSLTVFFMVINDLGYSVKIEEFYIAFLAIPFVIGPLHYLFASHLIQPSRRFNKKDTLHFIPAFLALIVLPTMVYLSPMPVAVRPEELDRSVEHYLLLLNWLMFVHAMTYALLSTVKLRQHRRKIRNVFSSIEKVQLNWLLNITYLILAVLAVFAIENILMSFGIRLTNYYAGSSIMIAVYIYTLGYMGILRMDVFLDPRVSSSIQQVPEASVADRQKYQKSGLSQEKAAEYLDHLLTFMEAKKPFHDNGLTLNQLAEMVNLTPHNLSEILNTLLGKNFFDFINSYRVNEVKAALQDATKSHLTLLAIAFDAGFNSKTAFNTIFKKSTGKTPSEYRQTAT